MEIAFCVVWMKTETAWQVTLVIGNYSYSVIHNPGAHAYIEVAAKELCWKLLLPQHSLYYRCCSPDGFDLLDLPRNSITIVVSSYNTTRMAVDNETNRLLRNGKLYAWMGAFNHGTYWQQLKAELVSVDLDSLEGTREGIIRMFESPYWTP